MKMRSRQNQLSFKRRREQIAAGARLTQPMRPVANAHAIESLPVRGTGFDPRDGAFDTGLLDRCRDQWRRGDWDALVQLVPEEIERHPSRARLALMVAAAHQALGHHGETHLFARLAGQWGGEAKLVARVLLAGIHNTLGRAVAIVGKDRERAMYHFNQAIAPGVPAASRTLATQSRVRQQLEQLRLGAEATALLAGRTSTAIPSDSAVSQPFGVLEDTLRAPSTPTQWVKPQRTDVDMDEHQGSAKVVAAPPKPSASRAAKETVTTSTDAEIDPFVADIRPFFFSKKITYVDAGAYHADVFLRLERLGIVIREAHLFEPNARSLEKLKVNVKAAKAVNVQIHECALGESIGSCRYVDSASMTRMMFDHESDGMTAEVRTLDSMARHITDRHIHLLKIDVEGSECAVLRGAAELLTSQSIDVIYVEAGFSQTNTQQTYFQHIVDLLQTYQYRIFRIYEQKNEWIEDSPVLRRANICFMSAKFAGTNPLSVVMELMRLRQASIAE